MSSPVEPNALERYHRDHCRKLSRRRESAKKKRYTFQPYFHDLERRMMPSTYVVSNTSDQGLGSLRQAILDSNAAGGTNNVAFQIPDNNSNPEAYVITLTSGPLPAITNALTVDGTTETAFLGKPAVVEIDGGSLSGTPDGVTLSTGSKGSEILGLQILDFGGDGILVQSANDTIGGPTVVAANIISGNTTFGIEISGSTATGNVIEGDFVGTDVTGTVAIANGTGVEVDTGASANTIGGLTTTPGTGAGNVISGNTSDGVDLSGGGTAANVIEGDLIGTNAAGTAALANAQGVYIEGTAGSNTIGGTNAGARDVISGNTGSGVVIGTYGTGNTQGSVVEGDYIGTSVTGDVSLGNELGIYIGETANNTIGGTDYGAGNVIAGNDGNSLAALPKS